MSVKAAVRSMSVGEHVRDDAVAVPHGELQCGSALLYSTVESWTP